MRRVWRLAQVTRQMQQMRRKESDASVMREWPYRSMKMMLQRSWRLAGKIVGEERLLVGSSRSCASDRSLRCFKLVWAILSRTTSCGRTRLGFSSPSSASPGRPQNVRAENELFIKEHHLETSLDHGFSTSHLIFERVSWKPLSLAGLPLASLRDAMKEQWVLDAQQSTSGDILGRRVTGSSRGSTACHSHDMP